MHQKYKKLHICSNSYIIACINLLTRTQVPSFRFAMRRPFSLLEFGKFGINYYVAYVHHDSTGYASWLLPLVCLLAAPCLPATYIIIFYVQSMHSSYSCWEAIEFVYLHHQNTYCVYNLHYIEICLLMTSRTYSKKDMTSSNKKKII